MIRKYNKYRIIYVVPVVILALSFFISLFNYNNVVFAIESGEITRTISRFKIDDNLYGEMENNTIKIWAKSKAAGDDTKVRYLTIGFGVSLSCVDYTANSKGLKGPASPSNVGFFMLDTAEKEDVGTSDGWTTTLYTFSKDRVNEALAGKLQNITNDTTVYLNTIFQSYYLNDDGTKTIRKGSGGGLTSWEEIMNAEWWGEDSLEGFSKYYNVPVGFSPGTQPISLYYRYEGITEPVLQGELTSLNINAEVKFSGKASYATLYKEKTYILKGFEIETKEAKIQLPNNSSWVAPANGTENSIMTDFNNKSIQVPWGGINIYIDYAVPSLYSNTLYYKKDNGAVKRASALNKLKAGEILNWANEVSANPPSIFFGAGSNTLVGYEIRSKESKKLLHSIYKSTSNGITDSMILNGTHIVVLGGLDVTLVYGNLITSPPPTTPIPTPPPGITPTPAPTTPPLIIPVGGYEYKTLDPIEAIGEIRADLRDAERFNVVQGIPSTESLYTQVRGSEYNIGYQLNKKVVIKNYSVKVSKTFTLKWTDAKDKTIIRTEEVIVPQTISVERACAFWEIYKFDYYTLDKAVISNKALPGGMSVMYPNGSYYLPSDFVSNHDDRETYHIIPPIQVMEGIILDPETLPMGDGVKPTIPKQDFTYEANVRTDEIKVRNDYLSFAGMVIMENSIYEKETPDLTNLDILNIPALLSNPSTLYKWDMVIPALTLNNIYYSGGTLTYRNNTLAVNPSSLTYDAPIRGLNDVVVHTPIICDASIKTANTATGITSNDSYVQALTVEEDCIQLVIDPDEKLSDFTVDINNYGKHLNMAGYFTRDFSWGLRDSRVAYLAEKNNIYRNEVKFPFDVFYQTSSGQDEYITKNTWMRFGHNTPTFYLPMWVNEGKYAVEFRTIAVNGVNTESQINETQTYANTDRSNYVAIDTVYVQVSGRIFGLSIYDISDYPTWETVFRKETGSTMLKLNEEYPSGVKQTKFNVGYAYDYGVGLSDQYGIETGRLKRFTLPLVNGSHPKYTNVGIMKTGYAVKFKVTTTGNSFANDDSVVIKPRFYYVDAEGNNRQEVDIYYNESFNGTNNKLVKMGGSLDLTNIKQYQCGDLYTGIPANQLKIMAEIKKKVYGNYLWEKTDLFTYTKIRIHSPLMTYVNSNYQLNLKGGDQYSLIKTAGITDTDIIRRMQTFYAQYYFPADIKAVEKGFDVYGYASKYGVGKNEAFWLNGGYIIINFDIVTEDGEGNKNLSYINSINAKKGYCSMWSMENPVTNKVSYNGKKDKSTVFNFLPGDFMVYFTDKSIKDDYVTYTIN